MKHQYFGYRRILSAFKNSFDGFIYILKEEEAFRQDLLISFLLLLVMYIMPISLIEKILLFSGIFFVLFAEIVNSCIEACIDRISPDWHTLSKAAKDMGSLLVLFSFVYLICVWFGVLSQFFK